MELVMSIFTKSVCALSVAAAFAAAPVSAAIVSADFIAEFDLPDASSSLGARVVDNNGALLGAGDELSLDDEVSNPSGWMGGVSVDLTEDGLLTFTGRAGSANQNADFDFAMIMISDIMTDDGREIIGFESVGTPNIFTTQGLSPQPFIRSGPDFFLISIDTTSSGNNSDFYFRDGGTVQYQLEFSPAVVPLPAGGLLLATGLLGFGLVRRNRQLS